MLTLVCTLMILTIIYAFSACYFRNKYKYWEDRNVPFVQPLLCFGNVLSFIFDNDNLRKYLINTSKKFNSPYYGMYVFSKPILVVKDLKIIKRIMITDFSSFTNKIFLCDKSCDAVFCSSLLCARDDEWRSTRHKFSSAFTSIKLKATVNSIQTCAENLVKYLENVSDKKVEVTSIMSKFSISVLSLYVFGFDFHCFDKNSTDFQKYSTNILPGGAIGLIRTFCYMFLHPLVKVLRMSFFNQSGVKYIRKIFEKVINAREADIKRNDFLDILLQLKGSAKTSYNSDEILGQAVLLFVAGYDTMTATISFTLFELSLNSAIQDRARQEVNDVLERHGSIKYTSLNDMKYLDIVLRETLRMYPVLSFLHREARDKYVIPETGLTLDRKTPIIIPIHDIHYNPDYFPHPHNYDPDRFLDENKAKVNPYTFLGFGIGPRNCIGKRFAFITMKIALAHVLRNFTVEVNSKTGSTLQMKASHVSQAKNGVNLTFKRL